MTPQDHDAVEALLAWITHHEDGRAVWARFRADPSRESAALRQWIEGHLGQLPPQLATYISGGRVDRLVNIARAGTVIIPPTRRRPWEQQTMLEKVRQNCKYLETLLARMVFVELNLAESLASVYHPLERLVQRPDHADESLPPGKPIIEIFDELGHELLILGKRGAGKTTLLLRLTRDLLQQADQDPDHPIPAVLLLSDWAVRRPPLVDWLVDALSKQYNVPRKTGRAWVEADQILPLLDGLDDVGPEHLAACVEAINAFRQVHGLVRLVVCSQVAAYEAVGIRLRMRGAIVVQPLSRMQVDSYLAQVGQPLAAVREVFEENPTFRKLLDTPLMLTIVTAAYAGRSRAALSTHEPATEWLRHIFADYVDRMLGRGAHRYDRQQTERWLAWLAWQMGQHSQTAFYLEHMQPDWLPREQRWRPTIGVGLAGLGLGLLYGLFGSPLLIMRGSAVPQWMTDLGIILVMGLFFGFVAYSKQIVSVETIRWSWSAAVSGLLDVTLKFGLYGGLGFGLLTLFFTLLEDSSPHIGLGVRLLLGLADGLVTVVFAPLLALPFGIIWGILKGLSGGEIDNKDTPNQGIHRSARYALIGWLGSVLVSVAPAALLTAVVAYMFHSWGLSDKLAELTGLNSPMNFRQLFGLLFAFIFIDAVPFGLLFGLHTGGRTCLQHLVLRLSLTRNGIMPWRYVDFLEFAGERLFLRRVSGGYSFIHGLLQDHFAARYLELDGMVPQESAQEEPAPSHGPEDGPAGAFEQKDTVSI